jgi:ABC-type amino acid transport substrate-binding protein
MQSLTTGAAMENRLIGLLLFLFPSLFCLSIQVVAADFIVSHREPAGGLDKRDEYTIALIQLALEKTKATYGPYQMKSIPGSFYNLRARIATSNNQFPNMLLEESYDDDYVSKSKLDFINFPIELGILGYRVCFVNPAVKTEIEQVQSLEGLKKYTIGQGIGWQDAKILKHNGFKVVEVDAYESLFKMVAAGRIDLFCTGVNQVMLEYNNHKNLEKLQLEQSFLFAYPLPRFFFIHRDNQLLKQRVEAGLKLAWQDGSLRKLWDEKFSESLRFVHMENRRVFYLDNPLIKALSKEHEQYNYTPKRLRKTP